MAVQRKELLRGMMDRLQTQDGHRPFNRNTEEWCALVMQTHLRLTGERIWCAPEREVGDPCQSWAAASSALRSGAASKT
jgi:hypothetical protein